MKLELQVLASTSIKRKKPWSRLAWIGQSQESIFLIDDHRLSVLYVPSGKTKRRITKLHGLLEDVTALNHSENGHFLVGLLRSGDVFLWHKDTDMLKYVQGLPELAQTLPNSSNNANRSHIPTVATKPSVYIADDGTKIVVVMNRSQLFVWERDPGQVLFAAKQADVKGSWSWVTPAANVCLPQPGSLECSNNVVFFISDTLGLCCTCSFVFNIGQMVCVTTALLRWCESQDIFTYSKPTFRVDWVSFQYPHTALTPSGRTVRAPGAYLCRHSHDGQFLAVAVNQCSSHDNKLMFVSPLNDTITVTDLKGSGARIPVTRGHRTYWVTDMAWTYDDLFVILMTCQGGIAIVTRLGEPLLLKTYGCSIEMGPKIYLPLHPLISVQVSPQSNETSESGAPADDLETVSLTQSDPMRQRFSVVPHPRLPIILCSDGYMVTTLQLPGEISCLSLMKGLLMESNRHLRRIRDQQKLNLTLYESMRRHGKVTKKLSLSAGVSGVRRLVVDRTRNQGHQGRFSEAHRPYRFEEPGDDIMHEDEDSSYQVTFGPDVTSGNMDAGKITFGDLDNLNTTTDFNVTNTEENLSVVQHTEQAKKTLMLAWSLGASHTGLWTIEHEDAATNIAHNFVRLFSAILQTRAEVDPELSLAQSDQSHPHKNLKLTKVLHIIKAVFEILNFDCVHQHLMVCAIRFGHSILRLLLTDPDLSKQDAPISNLHGCFVLLSFIERVIRNVYTYLPKDYITNSLPAKLQQDFIDVVEPAVLSTSSETLMVESRRKGRGFKMKGEGRTRRKLIKPMDEDREENLWYICHRSDIQKRLGPSWKLLYKHVIRYVKSIESRKVKSKVRQSVLDLLVTLQMKLTSLGQGHLLTLPRKLKVRPGDRLSIEGCAAPALKAWVYQLNTTQDPSPPPAVLRSLLLASLYSLLLQDELRAAVELTELLIRQQDIKAAAASCRQDQAKKWSVLGLLQQMPTSSSVKPPCYIKSLAVKCVVKSLARIMAAYFSNKTMFVYPAHAPRVIPPLHKVYNIKHRVIPLYHESMASVVRQDGLDGVWTPERAMEYLLLAGLLPEAVWFANRLGDWKTAYLLGVAVGEHRLLLPELYLRHSHQLRLSEDLQPKAILQARLEDAFGASDKSTAPGLLVDEESDLPALRHILMDLMMAATLSGVDLLPMLLQTLIGRLKHVTRQFSALVPEGLYLPAPPVYCPQPANTSQAGLGSDAFHEVALRHEASSLIQLVLLVLEGASCTLPTARWYARKVLGAFNKGQTFKADHEADLEELTVLQESFLQMESSFSGQERDPSVHAILACFRDFCSLVWLLYVRDKLSLGLRKKTKLVERKMHKSHVPRDTWLKHVKETLEWATHLVPFSHFLDAENDIFGVTLSLIIELPTNRETCSLLSQFFHNAESLDSELQDKLQLVLKEWQGIFISGPQGPSGSIRSERFPGKSPRGTSLSFYYHKQAQRMEKVYRQRAKVFNEYEVFVFDPELEEQEWQIGQNAPVSALHIGARPFESERAYLAFLDVFFAVSFNKVLDAEIESALPNPLLLHNSAEVREKELTSLAHKAVTSLHKRQNLSGINSPKRMTKQELSMSVRTESFKAQSPRARLPQSPRSKIGLFRSRSFSDLSNKKSKLPPFSPVVQRKKSSSQQDLSNVSDEEGFLEEHTRKSVPSSPASSPRGLQTKAIGTTGAVPGSTGEVIAPRMSLSRRCSMRRSCSVNDVDKAKAEKEQAKLQQPTEDPLLNPVMPPWLLDRIDFGEDFTTIEQLMEWLNRWAGRNHTLSTKVEHQVISATGSLCGSQGSLNVSYQQSPQKGPNSVLKVAGSSSALSGGTNPVMRIKVHPRLVVYTLWLLENHYFSTARPKYTATDPLSGGAEPIETIETATSLAGTVRGTSLNTTSDITAVGGESQCESQYESGRARSPDQTDRLGPCGDDTDQDVPLMSEGGSLWLDEDIDLEESYIQQMISAESNESISDGIIPRPKKSKMGILKKKKKDKKDERNTKDKITKDTDEVTSVMTSDTLMRRLPFKLPADNGVVEVPQNPQNSSQVSDSTLNVSSLNEEEMHETMRQTMTSLHKQHSPIHKPPHTHKGLRPRSLEREYSTQKEKVKMEEDVGETAPVSGARVVVSPLSLPDTPREADDLRDIVRQELRKIVEAQHHGILAMLGNLGVQDKAPLEASTPHDPNPSDLSTKNTSKKHSKKKKSHSHKESSKEASMQADNTDLSFNDHSSITEINITPLPSDDVSLKSYMDKPLTVSDLVKSKTWSPGVRYDPSHDGTNVRGALKELKSLENSQASNHVHFDLRSEDGRLGQNDTLRMTRSDGKENRYIAMPLLTLTPQQGPAQGVLPMQGGAPLRATPSQPPPHTQQHQFARVFEMLNVFNQKVGKAAPSGLSNTEPSLGPRLLYMSNKEETPRVTFPSIPSSRPSPVGVTSQSGPAPRMPLLHTYTPHQVDEVPVRDVPAHLRTSLPQGHNSLQSDPAAFRMPLLQMKRPTPHERVFHHIEDKEGGLQLVPSDDVMDYEQDKYQKALRKKQEIRRAQRELLRLSDDSEETATKAGSGTENRKQERKKGRKEVGGRQQGLQRNLKLAREDDESDPDELTSTIADKFVQVAGPETATQEVQVSYERTPRDLRSTAMQYPTPRTPRAGTSTEDEEVQLHQGYALSQGIFDDYLLKDGEMGSALDSAARIHYRATSALKPKKLKEVGTETDGPGWQEQSTIISRDTGTDPVAEALESYMKAKKGLSAAGMLAPDIFMGLNFSETPVAGPSTERNAGTNHAFINVVDLDGDALEDIVSFVPGQEDKATDRRTRSKQKQATPGKRTRFEGVDPERVTDEEDQRQGPDHVTSRVLGNRRHDTPDERSADDILRRSRLNTKESIKRRLEDMNVQFKAIDAMSSNIEEDYKNARLLLHTIEQIGEAIEPTPDIQREYPPAQVLRDHEERPEFVTKLQPSQVRKFNQEDRQREKDQDKYMSIPEVSDEDVDVNEHVKDIRRRLGQSDNIERFDEPSIRDHDQGAQPNETNLDLTGLSGVSDIVGEVVASGAVDPARLGLSDRQARKLAQKAVSARDPATLEALRLSAEEKKEKLSQRTEKEREEVREWMETKKRERNAEYKQQQQRCREMEYNPYTPADDSITSTLTRKELEESERKRMTEKQQRHHENSEKRMMMASELMGDILSDRPMLREDPGVRPRTSSKSPVRHGIGVPPGRRETSPARRGAPVTVGSRPGRPEHKVAWRENADVTADPDRTNLHANDYMHIRDSQDYDLYYRSGPSTGGEARRSLNLTRSGRLSNTAGTSSAGLRAYSQHLADMQDSYEPLSESKDHSVVQPKKTVKVNQLEPDQRQQYVYKPKPYTDKVKVQRPEVTRTQREFRSRPLTYVERLSQGQSGETPRTGTAEDVKAKQRLYGTTRIPGSKPDGGRKAPRTVKTYQERLREMKQARQRQRAPFRPYTGPLLPSGGGTTVTRPRPAASLSGSRRSTRLKKKPLTYAQQLQALQPPKELYRTGGTGVTPRQDEPIRRKKRGPPHKPMTYTEQLQKLQPPKELYRTGASYEESVPHVYRAPRQHGLRRSGPYPDPYLPPRQQSYQEDAEPGREDGVLSPWSVDENVQRIIYDGASTSYVGASYTGTDLDIAELQDLAAMGSEPPNYTDLVDIQDLADVAASVSSGSIMSFIDWDQIDQLIADIH